MDWDYSPPGSENDENSDFESDDNNTNNSSDTEEFVERDFDRNLPAEHSYLPGGLSSIQGRSILEAGWIGKMTCWCHKSIVFPGETIPMLFTNEQDLVVMQNIIENDKLFGLLFMRDFFNFAPAASPTYGVLCEVVEAGRVERNQPSSRNHLPFKVRARQRFIMKRVSETYGERLSCEIKILPDIVLRDPLVDLKFHPSHTKSSTQPKTMVNEFLHKTDSICTPWPRFVYDIFDEKLLIKTIKDYFRGFQFENLPGDILSLSFWVATNLAIPDDDRLALFATDNALLRLFLESRYIKQKNRMLCCALCMTEICDSEDMSAMSNEGIFSNYCNVAGFVHDIMTVHRVSNVSLQGRPSIKFTWFPGYLWTIASCACCGRHVGWRFTANIKSLRPQEFWGLARKSLTPRKSKING